jgi:hypothetical protein
MNPATITTSTFTVTAPGGANVAGTVSYAAATNIGNIYALEPSRCEHGLYSHHHHRGG